MGMIKIIYSIICLGFVTLFAENALPQPIVDFRARTSTSAPEEARSSVGVKSTDAFLPWEHSPEIPSLIPADDNIPPPPDCLAFDMRSLFSLLTHDEFEIRQAANECIIEKLLDALPSVQFDGRRFGDTIPVSEFLSLAASDGLAIGSDLEARRRAEKVVQDPRVSLAFEAWLVEAKLRGPEIAGLLLGSNVASSPAAFALATDGANMLDALHRNYSSVEVPIPLLAPLFRRFNFEQLSTRDRSELTHFNRSRLYFDESVVQTFTSDFGPNLMKRHFTLVYRNRHLITLDDIYPPQLRTLMVLLGRMPDSALHSSSISFSVWGTTVAPEPDSNLVFSVHGTPRAVRVEIVAPPPLRAGTGGGMEVGERAYAPAEYFRHWAETFENSTGPVTEIIEIGG